MKINNKPSKGIIIYCGISIICMIFSIIPGWQYIFGKIIKIGIYDQESLNIISDIFIKLWPPATRNARIIGGLIGAVVRLAIIIGIFTLKSWARKTEITLCAIAFIFLVIKLIPLVPQSFMPDFWIGYYLFNALSFLIMFAFLIIIFFLARPGIKKQFKRV